MRILIADDEYLARSSLRSMLEELNLPLEIVGEAKNGEEMKSLVSQHFPEIAFVDIRMPKLNGLETIRACRTISPQTKWFILTGYPVFDYAQEAIQLGVAGYLLKPVHPEELSRVLKDTIEENRIQKAAQNKQFERELIALNYGLTSLELEEKDSLILRSRFIGAIIPLDSHLEEKVKAERQFKFCRKIHERIEQSLDNRNGIALIVLPSGELATVGAWEPSVYCQAEQRVREYFQAIELEARQASNPELAISILVTKECPTYQDLQDQLDRLQKLAPLRVTCGVGKKIDLSVLIQQVEKPGRLELGNLALKICRAYQERDYWKYLKVLQLLEKALSNQDISGDSTASRAVADFFNRSTGCPLQPGRGFAEWIQALQGHGERLLSESAKVEIQTKEIIDQVIAFIDQNYMAEIGIGQLAERYYITPNYLSALFHKKTGVTFMGYLRNIRLLKAKELLADPNIQIQQVAKRVGYISPRHFARLFTEQFGCLPSEYRDRFKNR